MNIACSSWQETDHISVFENQMQQTQQAEIELFLSVNMICTPQI
jgi:hypothetical protein